MNRKVVLGWSHAGREKDLEFNQAMVASGLADKSTLIERVTAIPVDDSQKKRVLARLEQQFARPGASEP
jgi:hypothetical protein